MWRQLRSLRVCVEEVDSEVITDYHHLKICRRSQLRKGLIYLGMLYTHVM
jgi:hypothetical protein